MLIDDSPENVARVRRGLAVLADNAVADVKDTDVRDYVVVRVADEVVVDLMGKARGLTYEDVVRDADIIELGDVRVPVASPSTLMRTKDTYRPQDAIDRGFLEELIRRRARVEPEPS